MITDEVIDGYLAIVFGHSEPGQTLHNMIFASSPAAENTALGLPGTGQLAVTIYAIAPTQEVDADKFMALTIRAAIAEAQKNRMVPYFAALGAEAHGVDDDGNEVTDNLARRLHADRQLQNHPAACEVTMLYAACRDGRRWTGKHYLTGPKAGTIIGPNLQSGPVTAKEKGIHQRLIRAAVGLP